MTRTAMTEKIKLLNETMDENRVCKPLLVFFCRLFLQEEATSATFITAVVLRTCCYGASSLLIRYFVTVLITRTRFGDKAFAVAAPRVWNSLPTDIKFHRSTTPSFKRRFKTIIILFNRSFAEYI